MQENKDGGLEEDRQDFHLLRVQVALRFKHVTNDHLLFETDAHIDVDVIPENIRACKCCLRFLKRYLSLVVLHAENQHICLIKESALLPIRSPSFRTDAYGAFARHVQDAIARSKVTGVYCSKWPILGKPQTGHGAYWHLSATFAESDAPSRCLYRRHTLAVVKRAHQGSHTWTLWTWQFVLSQLEHSDYKCGFSLMDYVNAVIASYQNNDDALLRFVLSLTDKQLVCFRGFLKDVACFIGMIKDQNLLGRGPVLQCFLRVYFMHEVDPLLYVEHDGGERFYVWPIARAPASFLNQAPIADYEYNYMNSIKRVGFVVRRSQLRINRSNGTEPATMSAGSNTAEKREAKNKLAKSQPAEMPTKAENERAVLPGCFGTPEWQEVHNRWLEDQASERARQEKEREWLWG